MSPVTRRVLQYRLEQLASWLSNGAHTALSFPWHQLDYAHVMALRAHLQGAYKVGTANAYLKNVRVMARECWRLGLMSVEQFSKVQDVPNIPGESLPVGREVRPHELSTLFATIAKDTSPMGVRDAAMVAALYGTGMRRAGLAGLKVDDYDLHTVTFRIVEKGNKERESPAPSWVKEPMAAWLALRGDQPGALFVSFKWNRMDTTYAHMTPRLCGTCCAAVSMKPASPSSLPMTFAGPTSATCWKKGSMWQR